MTIHTIKDLQTTLDLAARERIACNALTAEMDAEITAIKTRFETKIEKHKTGEAALLAAAKAYAEEHRAELLSKGIKSLPLGGHKVGWNDNGGAVSFARGKPEKKVLASILKRPRLARLFVRMKPSLDKEAIAAKWARWGASLKGLGIRYGSSEVFFVELDITETPDARVKPEEAAGQP